MTATPVGNHYWQVARSACTDMQFEILELRERHGLSLRAIAYMTDRSPSTIRDHLHAAHRRVDHALQEARR